MALVCARLVAEAVWEYRGYVAGAGSVAEAGCASGLCAPVFLALGKTLVGVEPKAALATLAQHRIHDGRAPYAQVVTAPLSAFFQSHPDAFDLVVSAQALLSCAQLEDALAGFQRALHAQGLLAFTLGYAEEDISSCGIMPNADGGFSYTETYLRGALRDAGLSAKLVNPVTVGPNAVKRLLVLAKKPR